MADLSYLLALITLMFWPVVPLFWIPVHGFARFFRHLGKGTYIFPLITYIPIAYLIFSLRSSLLGPKVILPLFVIIAGWTFLAAGALLQLWTLILLRVSGLMGLPEVSPGVKGRLVTEGPFSIVRHPTYISHTLMYAGVFFVSGYLWVAVAALVDLTAVNFFVIPLEDRELAERFGEDYRIYKERVPAFFPRLF